MMRPLTAAELLNAWEQGLTQSPVQQALILLAAACPDIPQETLAQMSIGQRDGWLLMLREWMFGAQLMSVVACPACAERLELSFNVGDIRATPEYEPDALLTLTHDNYTLRFRLPNSLDVLATNQAADLASARRSLLGRCLLEAAHEGDPVMPEQLPDEVVDAIAAHMAQADPQADVQLALACPHCQHAWHATFDIASFFWNEINTWARRLLRDIHSLAVAYGWHEADIIAMSPWRRQAYIDMVHG